MTEKFLGPGARGEEEVAQPTAPTPPAPKTGSADDKESDK